MKVAAPKMITSSGLKKRLSGYPVRKPAITRIGVTSRIICTEPPAVIAMVTSITPLRAISTASTSSTRPPSTGMMIRPMKNSGRPALCLMSVSIELANAGHIDDTRRRHHQHEKRNQSARPRGALQKALLILPFGEAQTLGAGGLARIALLFE